MIIAFPLLSSNTGRRADIKVIFERDEQFWKYQIILDSFFQNVFNKQSTFKTYGPFGSEMSYGTENYKSTNSQQIQKAKHDMI